MGENDKNQRFLPFSLPCEQISMKRSSMKILPHINNAEISNILTNELIRFCASRLTWKTANFARIVYVIPTHMFGGVERGNFF